MIDIEKEQPPIYKDVLFYCEGGKFIVGMYWGNVIPKGHKLYGKPRKVFGKHGRYCEPAMDGYRVLRWCELPPINSL